MRNLVYRETISNYVFAAFPSSEHDGGNVPIQFFGKPFAIVSNETRYCPHVPTKVKIPFENRVWHTIKRTSCIRFSHNPRNYCNFFRYFSGGILQAFRILRKKLCSIWFDPMSKGLDPGCHVMLTCHGSFDRKHLYCSVTLSKQNASKIKKLNFSKLKKSTAGHLVF